MEDLVWRLVPLGVLVAQGAFGWVVWSMSKKFVTCEACQEKHYKSEQRMERVEGQFCSITGLPAAEEFASLGREVGEVQAGQAALQESVKGLSVSMDRLSHHINMLLEHHLREAAK